MSPVVISAWSALTSAGIGPATVAARLRDHSGSPGGREVGSGSGYGEELPASRAHVLDGFDIRAQLGRKGTSSFDRVTGLAVVCCREALDAAAMDLDAARRARIGVSLGTTVGSLRSTSDYTRETLVAEKPYLVNPMQFPSTVMNCAAGQVAIRFGLRGVNATIAGGPLAFLNGVRYAGMTIERGYADVMLTGAAEEYTPHRAWLSHLTGATGPLVTGEGAAMFVLRRPGLPAWAGTDPDAMILAISTAYGPGGGVQADQALTGCVRRALHRAAVTGAEVSTVVTGESGTSDVSEFLPATAALGHEPGRLLPKLSFGECGAASGAIALGALLSADCSGLGLITGRGLDGSVGAALVQGRAR